MRVVRVFAWLLVVGVTLAARNTPPAETDAPRVSTITHPARAHNPQAFAVGHGDAAIEVRPLDDPANPYLGRYTASDRWIYEHAISLEELQGWRSDFDRWRSENPGADEKYDGGRILGVFVDPDGWMRPAAYWKTNPEEERRKQWPIFDRELEDRKPWLNVDGIPRQLFATNAPSEIAAEFDLQFRLYDASRTPKIPDWLVALAPYWTVLVPNGEILTCGRQSSVDSVEVDWRRYASDGTLLEQVPATNNIEQIQAGSTKLFHVTEWTKFYWPDRERVLAGEDGKHYGRYRDSGGAYWVQYLHSEEGATPATYKRQQARGPLPVAAFRYDGKPLDIFSPVPEELTIQRVLEGEELAKLYEVQQHFQVWWGKD